MKRLEYLESTGTQYINTGVKGNLNTEVEVKVSQITASTQKTITIFGDNTTNSQAITINLATDTTNRNQRFGDKKQATNYQHNLEQDYTIKTNKSKMTVNGITYVTFNTTTTFTTTNNLLLFRSGGITTDYYNGTTRVYYCKIFDNEILIRYFVPVEDDEGVGCLLDLVTGEYYYNQGTGTFTKGLRLDIYTPIEYIESTGTQYIDSGIKPNPTTRVLMECITTSYTQQHSFFGERDSSGFYYNMYINSANNYSFAYGDTAEWVRSNKTVVTNSKITIDFNGYGKQFTISGGTSYTASLSSYTATNTSQYNLFILAENVNGSVATNSLAKIKLYNLKIYDNNEIIRDYIPVLDKNDIPCLYDLVSDTYYYNQGTGDFIGGDVMPMAVADTAGLQQIANNIKGALNTKQDTLTQGTNITIDGTTISATDTKNTTGSTDTSNKIYLVGATSQTTDSQTYSDNEIYTTDGVLTTKSVQVGGTAVTMEYNSTNKSVEFNFA